MSEQIKTSSPEIIEPTQATTQARMSEIEHLKEDSLSEVLTKKKAFNDLIPVLSSLLQNVGRPSMDSIDSKPTDPVDSAIEAESDNQDSDLIVSAMKHARNEMVRLGDKEEAMLGSADTAA
jgi:hypothetical protein